MTVRAGVAAVARRCSSVCGLTGCGTASVSEPAVRRRRAGRSRPRRPTPTTSSPPSTTRGSRSRPARTWTYDVTDVAGDHALTVTVEAGPEVAGVADHRPGQHRGRTQVVDRLVRPGHAATCGGSAATGELAGGRRRRRGRAGDGRRPRGSATATGTALAPGVVRGRRDGRRARRAGRRAGRDVRRRCWSPSSAPARAGRSASRRTPRGSAWSRSASCPAATGRSQLVPTSR